jgi:hypothetical protein
METKAVCSVVQQDAAGFVFRNIHFKHFAKRKEMIHVKDWGEAQLHSYVALRT